MNKKEKIDFSRRHALKIIGAATAVPLMRNPVSHLIDSMVGGMIHSAKAEASGAKNPRNLMVFYMANGAPRWILDCVYDPYKPGIANNGWQQVISGFNSAGAPGVFKNETNFSHGRTLYLPPIWNSTLPGKSAGSVKMSEILRNALVIQGVNMLADGHPGNADALVMPVPSAPTYGGYIAEASPTSIPAINLPYGRWNHRALSGAGISSIGGYSDPLSALLSPFKQKSTDMAFLSRRDAMDIAMKSAMSKLGAFAGSRDPAAQSLFSNQSKAEKLLKTSLGDLSGSYSTLYNKYSALVRLAIDGTKTGVTGVTDNLITASAFPNEHKQFDFGGGTIISEKADLRDMITGSTYVEALIENFAITEYMIVNGFSQYVSAGFGNVGNLKPMNTAQNFTLSGDEHSVGAIISLIVNTARYRAFYTCLHELIAVLKQSNLWSESVILYGSEFNRAPKANGSGSDHAWWANVYTILSGAIDGPYFVGNTSDAQGYRAPTQVDSSKVEFLTRGYVASTVAAAVRIDSPSPNNSSFLIENASGSLELGGIELSKAA